MPRGPARLSAAVWCVALTAALAVGCKDKKEEAPDPGPPVQGSASVDELTTGVGLARGLEASLAPTSTKWTRAIVLDDKRAILAGEVVGASIVMSTNDAGRTWHSARVEPEGWSGWGFGADGTTVLASGANEVPKGKLPAGKRPRFDSVNLRFAPLGESELSAPFELIAPGGAKELPRVPEGSGIPAVLSKTSVALFVEPKPRLSAVLHGGPPGTEPQTPIELPKTERVIPTPYARPPKMLSVARNALLSRPVPEMGAALADPTPVAGVVASPVAIAELSEPPVCEVGPWTFQRLTQPGKTVLFGVSDKSTVVVPLPANAVKDAPIGCSKDTIVVQTKAPDEDVESLVLCAFDGTCQSPENRPFRAWTVPHQRSILAVPTKQGSVAVMSERAGERWGLYLSQTLDDGKLYELARIVGEGTSDRAIIEVGALLSFGDRVVLLISTVVTGTSRRGYYVMASDDGGTTWNPP